jgi:predicted dinucleotide-binding enzyme
MRITTVGRGRVGGALALRWRAAGHDVTMLGRDGGNATGSDVVLVATPGVDDEPVRPGTLFAADPEARATTEALIRDAGFDPIHLGDLGQAALLESLIDVTRALETGDLGPFFYRFNRPGEIPAP